MKKKALFTAILFSSILLAGNGLVEQPNDILASEVNKKENLIQNKIRFIDQDGYYVKDGYSSSFFTVEGEENEVVDLSNILPKGFEFIDNKDSIFKINSNEDITEISVNALEIENTIQLTNGRGDIIKEFKIVGKTDSIISFPLDELPKGYKLIDERISTIKISSEYPIQQFMISKTDIDDRDIVNVSLKYVDTDGIMLDSENISGYVGDKHYLDKDYSSGRLKGYVFDEDQPLEFVFKKGVKEVIVKMKDIRVANTVIFKDEKGQIGVNYIRGIVGEKVYVDLPSGYINDNDDENFCYVVLGEKGTDIIVNVVKKYYNAIRYITNTGIVVKEEEISGRSNKSVIASNLTGFNIVSDRNVKIKPKDGYVHTILVDGMSQKIKLIFKTWELSENGGASQEDHSTIELTGKSGDRIPKELLPKGYGINDEQSFFSGERVQEVTLRKIINTKINYVTYNGKVISIQNDTSLEGREIRLNIPKGYITIDTKEILANRFKTYRTILIVPQNESQIPELPQEQGKIKTQLNFIDRETNKIVHGYLVEGKHGQVISIQVPNGYNLDKGFTNKLTLDISKTKINIYVTEKKTNSVAEAHSTVVSTKSVSVRIYDSEGNVHNHRALGSNSGWQVDQKRIINGRLQI